MARSTRSGRRVEEAVIAAPSWELTKSYVAGWLPEDEVLTAARKRAADVDATPIGPDGGATLRFLATVVAARAVVELGTGAGVSGLWLLRGMAADGVLTSVDVEGEHQRLARRAFADEGVAPVRTRLIVGRALEVLPRLADASYDMVFADAAKSEYPDYLEQAIRLLRPGGVLAFDNALWHDRVADSTNNDPDTVAVRELGRLVLEDARLVPALLPVGDGLLVAVRQGGPTR